MRRILLAALIATMPVASALADNHDWPLESDITISEAIEIAMAQGITLIRSIEFDDGLWEVEGRNADGAQIAVEISGATGELVEPR